ncbi:Transforming growth factor [Dirofilaria immitis]
MIAINAYAQFRVQVTHLSRQESEECISKQAYYDVENNHISIISMDFKCDKLLIDAFEKAIITPENLKIQIINSPQVFENILRAALDLCYTTIIQDLSEEDVTWFLFDCAKNGKMNKSKGGIKWLIIISLILVAIIICVSIGICCYLVSRKRNRKHSQTQQSLSKQQIADRNINDLSGESTDIKSYSTSTKKSLSDIKCKSPGRAENQEIFPIKK